MNLKLNQMKKLMIFILLSVVADFSASAQNNPFSYQMQYSLINVATTSGDTLYDTECMLNLDNVSNPIQQIEISIGTTAGASDVRSMNIPFNNGTQLALFNSNKKGTARIGSLPGANGTPYFYSIRLKYKDGTYSMPVAMSSVVN